MVAVHDVGTQGDRVYVAMEFVEGQTLRDWMRQGNQGKGTFSPRPWPEVDEVFRRAGTGLAAANEQGVVHRDFAGCLPARPVSGAANATFRRSYPAMHLCGKRWKALLSAEMLQSDE